PHLELPPIPNRPGLNPGGLTAPVLNSPPSLATLTPRLLPSPIPESSDHVPCSDDGQAHEDADSKCDQVLGQHILLPLLCVTDRVVGLVGSHGYCYCFSN